MSCFLETENDKTVAILTFQREQLLYDIKNYSYIEGHIMDTDSDHVRHTVQDVGEEGNVDRVTRVLNLGIAKCREALYPYTKHEITRTALDDVLREPEVYGIVLKLPKEFSQTTLKLLEKVIHEYLVCCGVADWMSITNPAKAQTWALKMEEMEREMRKCLNSRMGRKARIRLNPF